MSLPKSFGHYQVKAEIGSGGMATVYKCWEASLHRFVAVKVLAEHLAKDKELKERFLREAKSMAAISHPNVIQIHFIGEQDGQPYFAMEYIQGQSLEELLQAKMALSLEHANNILFQAGEGLLAAHNQGLIHRDIKPGNLMLTENGILKLVDFGIALSNSFDKKITSKGELVGTPGYLSPEVCIGQAVDIRADIFSLGIVYYQMLAGDIPFDNDSPLGLLLDVVESNIVDIRKINKNVSKKSAQILKKMIARNPDDRYQNCQEILDALGEPPMKSSIATIVDNYTKINFVVSKIHKKSNSQPTLLKNLIEDETQSRTLQKKPSILALVILFVVLPIGVYFYTGNKKNSTLRETSTHDFITNDSSNSPIDKDKTVAVEFVNDASEIIHNDSDLPAVAESVPDSVPIKKPKTKKPIVKTKKSNKPVLSKGYKCIEVNQFALVKKKKTWWSIKRKPLPKKLLQKLQTKIVLDLSRNLSKIKVYKAAKTRCPNNDQSLVLSLKVSNYKKNVKQVSKKDKPSSDKLTIVATLMQKKSKTRLAQKSLRDGSLSEQLKTDSLLLSKDISKFIQAAM